MISGDTSPTSVTGQCRSVSRPSNHFASCLCSAFLNQTHKKWSKYLRPFYRNSSSLIIFSSHFISCSAKKQLEFLHTPRDCTAGQVTSSLRFYQGFTVQPDLMTHITENTCLTMQCLWLVIVCLISVNDLITVFKWTGEHVVANIKHKFFFPTFWDVY